MRSKHAKPCHCGKPFCMVCPLPKPTRRRPTDSERLDALLTWWPVDREGLWVWMHGAWRVIKTRRDIDKLMREEARRG